MTGFPSPNTRLKLPVIAARPLPILPSLAAAEESDKPDVGLSSTQRPHTALPLKDHTRPIERGRIFTIRTQVGNMCGFLVVEHLIDEALPELR
jgi:hypothetical protein